MQMADGGGGGGAAIGSAASSIFDSMATFAKTAASGGFEVSAEGGKALLETIENFQKWVDDQASNIDGIAQQRKLGSSNGAQVMAPFTQQVATDGQGFGTQLKALQISLNEAKKGIEKAMANYAETEHANQLKSSNIQV
jgi:hypothetical protein